MIKIKKKELCVYIIDTFLMVNGTPYSLPKDATKEDSEELSIIGEEIVVNGYIFDIKTETFRKQTLLDKIKSWFV